MSHRVTGAVLLSVLLTSWISPSSGAAALLLMPQVIWIPPDYHTGGAYAAIQAGPDGRVYLGTTFYGGVGRLLAITPDGRVQVLADMASATGEPASGPYAQAKIHTKPAVAPDGRVYFGTKSGQPAREAAQSPYPGGHLLVYDPRAGRVTDLGIPRPRQSIIAVGIDPRRGTVYALTDPEEHLITYEPSGRTFADRGVLADTLQPTRYLVVLANGDVFHPAVGEAVMRYQAASGRIERLPLQFTGLGRYEAPYALAADPDGTRFHGVGQRSGEVTTFQPQDHTVTVLLHGAAFPDGFGPPGTHYTMTAAPDGNMYYTAVLGGSDAGTLFIMRLVAATGRPEVVGQVAALPAQSPWPPAAHLRPPAREVLIEGSTASPDGTLYVMTAYPLRVLVFPRLAARR